GGEDRQIGIEHPGVFEPEEVGPVVLAGFLDAPVQLLARQIFRVELLEIVSGGETTHGVEAPRGGAAERRPAGPDLRAGPGWGRGSGSGRCACRPARSPPACR